MYVLLSILAVVAVSHGAVVPGITGWATCDNEMWLYADGVLKAHNGDWPVASYVTLPADTQVVAIKCVDVGVIAGIKAAFDNGVKTDSSWKCSNTAASGWNMAGYDDSSWGNGVVHTHSAWGSSPSVLEGKADWIWTDGWTGTDLTVHCRIKFRDEEVVTGGYDCDRNNPCTSLSNDDIINHRFYYPHITDPHRFIQCSQWGQCYVMPCAPGTQWNQDLYTCA